MSSMRVWLPFLLFAFASAQGNSCAADDSACEACSAEMNKINVSCTSMAVLQASPSAETLEAVATDVCQPGTCKDYIDKTVQLCSGTVKAQEVTRVQELCDTASCSYQVMKIPFTCPLEETQTPAEELRKGFCGEGACKDLVDGAMTACGADAEMKQNMQRLQQMCHPCKLGLQEAAEKCMKDGMLDPEAMCGDGCTAVMQSFATNNCQEWMPDRRLAQIAAEHSKHLGRRLQNHSSSVVGHSGSATDASPGETIAVMMGFIENTCSCVGEIMKVTAECPVVDDKTGEDTDKVKQLCEPGACKTAMDGAISKCGSAEQGGQVAMEVQQFNSTAAAVDSVCALAPCMDALSQMPASCPGMDSMQGEKPTPDMLKMICEEGACKADLDIAVQTCSGQPEAKAQQFMEKVPGLNMLCTPCMKTVVGIPAACPSLTQVHDSMSEAMLTEICDAGNCRTELDKATQECSGHDEDEAKELMADMTGLNAMCAPCMRNIVTAISACGIPTDGAGELDVKKVCANDCQNVLKDMEDQKCFSDGRRLSHPMYAKLKFPRRLGDHEMSGASMAQMVTELKGMCSGETCPGAMVGVMTSCPRLFTEMTTLSQGQAPSQSLRDQICQAGDCKSAVDRTAAACEKDGAENGRNIQMIAAVCDPCLSNMMRMPKVCGADMHKPNPDEFCGTECAALVTSMKNDKCEEKDWRFIMGGRRLGGDEEHNPAEALKEMYAMMDKGCTDCGKAALAAVNHNCVNEQGEPDPGLAGCQVHVCKIFSDCPANPASSPIPSLELAEYNEVRAKIQPPCEAAAQLEEVLSGAERTIRGIGFFGIVAALSAA